MFAGRKRCAQFDLFADRRKNHRVRADDVATANSVHAKRPTNLPCY
jgi:hypothetical protein